jgi:hypothetical protein
MADAVGQPGCPPCGQPVSTTVRISETGGKFAADRLECPSGRL